MTTRTVRGSGRCAKGRSLAGCPAGSRVPRPLGVLIAMLALGALMSPAARGAGVPIRGKLLVEYWDQSSLRHTYFMEGTSDDKVPLSWTADLPELSPDTTRVAYSFLVPSDPYPEAADIWVANLDGSDAVNLTGPTTLGGVNCNPTWSPDGQMVAFQHSDPEVGEPRCGEGFQIWLMNADGTNLHQWIASPTVLTMSASWAPDGRHIACEGPNQSCLIGDVTGANLRLLPGVNGRDVEWSRDGNRIAYTTSEPGWLPDGSGGWELGVWERLRLADADGSNVQVLVEQAVTDSDIGAHVALHDLQPADADWVAEIRWWVGPRKLKWSPLGDRIAFLAALPFDPDGPEFWYQVEVWLYDLSTAELIRLTSDTTWDEWLSWAGPNTYPDSPQVTVGSTTVTFADVSEAGVTTIMRDDDPPDVPTGFFFDYAFYELDTTAEITGPITICMTYTDEEVPPAAEADLAILHWDGAEWTDITTSRDPVNNTICGQTDSLSPIALHGIRITTFSDVPAWGFGTDGLDPHWAYYQVMACAEARIVSGYGDGTYQPTNSVSRDQMAVFISRAMAGGDANVPAGPGTATFDDVPAGYWAYDYVEYCAANDVVQGYSPTTYGPADLVSRDSMAVFIARAVAGGDAGVPDGPAEATFDDVPTDYWSYKYIEYCAGEEIVQGYDPVTYGPTGLVTRDQMAVFITRAFGLTM